MQNTEDSQISIMPHDFRKDPLQAPNSKAILITQMVHFTSCKRLTRYPMPNTTISRKVVVVGDDKCGKTSLLHRYVKGDLPTVQTTGQVKWLRCWSLQGISWEMLRQSYCLYYSQAIWSRSSPDALWYYGRWLLWSATTPVLYGHSHIPRLFRCRWTRHTHECFG